MADVANMHEGVIEICFWTVGVCLNLFQHKKEDDKEIFGKLQITLQASPLTVTPVTVTQ